MRQVKRVPCNQIKQAYSSYCDSQKMVTTNENIQVGYVYSQKQNSAVLLSKLQFLCRTLPPELRTIIIIVML